MEKKEIIINAKLCANAITHNMTNDEMVAFLEKVFNIIISSEALSALPDFFGQTKDFKTKDLKLQWRLWTLVWLTNKLGQQTRFDGFEELMSVINQISK